MATPPPSPPPWLLEEMKNIDGACEPTLIIKEKVITASDLNPNEARLTIPCGQIVNVDFLRESEKQHLEENSLPVTFIDPDRRKYDLELRKWKLFLVLAKKWSEVRKANRFQANDKHPLWCFRSGTGNIFFALLPKIGEESSIPPPSSGAASSAAVASTSAEPQIRNPNAILPSTSISPITMSQEDQILSRSSHLTRTELLRRRSHILKQLIKCYRDLYWALMEEIKAKHRDYYWEFGVSPFKDEQNQPNKRRRLGPEGETGDGDAVEGSGDNGTNNEWGNGVKADQYANSNCGSCMYDGCKGKAMALTNYCQLHILEDSKQKLYTGCTNVIKREPAGPVLCGKPTLASTVPALCTMHYQDAQKDAARALKDAGHNVSSTNKPPPKLHDIVAAFVNHNQAKRKKSTD